MTRSKRGLSRLAALALAFILALGSSVPAGAEGDAYTPKDPYILNAGESSQYVFIYAQYSPFVPTLTYDGETMEGYSIIFGLYDTYNDEALESFYCTDLPVDVTDTNYRPLNLSDSTYAAAVADQLRGIVLNTYPNLTVEELARSSGITGLTRGEAITASQLAVWKTAHGDSVEITNFMARTNYGNRGQSAIQKELDAEHKEYDNGDDTYQAAVKGRIEALYHYLMSLAPVGEKKRVVSESAFVSRSTEPTLARQTDGTYNVSVEATVRVQMDGEDALTLTAHMADGEYSTQQSLKDGDNSCSLTIKDVPAAAAYSTVTLAIDGTQTTTTEDVYLIDAKGIRGVSQSMIGVYAAAFPVHAEVKAEPDRVLNIHKTDGKGGGLANISFEVYYVGSLEDYLSGKLNVGAKPTDGDIKRYAKPEKLVGTLTTDADGKASLNLHTEDGFYLVKELLNDAVTATVTPFFVSLPDYSRKDGEGKLPSYTITAEPKNTVKNDEVDITKDVTELDNKHDTYDVGEEHPWIIRTTLPKTLASGKSYVITDTLDSQLNYVSLTKVELCEKTTSAAGEEESVKWEPVLTLAKDTDFTLTTGTTTDTAGRTVDTFTVSLTTTGMKKVAEKVGTATNYELHTYFTAQINTTAKMGEEIPNQAHVSFTNGVGVEFKADSDKPEVHTGAAELVKVDASDSTRTLSGAEFEVYRKATQEEIAADKEKNELPQLTIGNTTYKMVKVSFYDNASMTGEKKTTLTTDEDGKGYLYGLAYGEYYLVETKAPAGYNLSSVPTDFHVNGETSTLAEQITVTNTTGVELPTTGGMGTGAFTALGLALTGGAAVLLVRRKRSIS